MEELKEMKFGDLLNLLADMVNNKNSEEKENVILSKEEVLQQFPIFTESSLRKAVKYQGLEFIKSGRCRYYDKKSVEAWIEQQKQKEIYNRFEEIKF